MDSKWERKRILIWGKTRPELSKKYREIVCTGGVFEDTKKLVRIYPIPLRFIDDEKVFKKYQWIEAYITKNVSDARPESYKIRADLIEIGEVIPTKRGNWDDRAKWVMQSGNIFQSVEDLKKAQKLDHTSLGLIKPLEVTDITVERYSSNERDAFWGKYQDAIKQIDLPFDTESGKLVKPLTPPDYRYKIQFQCDDPNCKKPHNFSVLDWEMDALYFNLRMRGDDPHVAARKVEEKLRQVTSEDKDLHFYLGNIATHPHIFTIVGLWWPKKK